MRKIYSALIFLLIIGLGMFFMRSEDKALTKNTLKTSELLIQEQIDAKIERRKNGYAKQDKPDKFLEHIYKLKTGGDPNVEYKFNNALSELKRAKLKSAQLKASKVLDWKQRGPGNVGGRTRGLVIDPDDASANTWFTGPVGGGVWKTTDGGQSWLCLTMDWPNLSVASLVMAESNHDVLYAGTGEGFGNVDAIKGNGIFKSIDRGDSWVHLTSTIDNSDFSYVSRLVIDPVDENIVVAATNTGIQRSTDGGLNWQYVYSAEEKVQDLRAKPGDFNTLFATDNNIGILTSIDAGKSWKLSKEIKRGRIELATSTINPDYVYGLTSSSELFVSVDGGDNWEETTVAEKVEFLSGQGWYNNTLAVSPDDETKIYVGGLELHSVTLGDEENTTGTSVFDVQLENTSFLSWSDIGGEYVAGGIKMESDNNTLYTDVEITFGSGISQKAHRFITTSTASIPALADMVYQDYVDVPFKVIDKASGEQLMVSFRDDVEDNVFEPGVDTKEQIYIHAVAYDASNASSDIAMSEGAGYNRFLVLNPVVSDTYTWDGANLPTASITLDTYALKRRAITSNKLSVWYPRSSSRYSHADHHNIGITKSVGNPFRIVNCNDGGVFISDDGGVTWEERTTGYVTSQLYGVSKHPGKNIYIGGMQDNGTWISPEDPDEASVWDNAWGGDGFETAWNASDPDKLAMSIYNNEIKITYNGGQSWITADIGDVGNDAPFVTRIANEISNPELMFVGGASGVWRSPDFGENWSLVTMPSGTWNYGSDLPHVAISPVNSRYVWAGNAISGSNALAYSTDEGLSFSVMGKPTGVGAYIADLIAHPTNENGIYVLFSQNGHPKIIYTEDKGENWTDLSQFSGGTSTNGFPNVAVYSLVVMPHDTDILWAGTEIGIFESTDGGQSWHFADNGFPAVCIWDMKIVGQQVVVATHGLGVWTLDVPEIPALLKKPYIKAGKNPEGKIAVNFELETEYDLVELYFNGELAKTYENTTVGSFSDAVEFSSTSQTISIEAKGKFETQSAISNVITMDNYVVYAPVQKYVNPFTTKQDDFTGTGYTISNELFDDWAIHTSHPYDVDQNLVYQLNYPIEVMADAGAAVLSYRDITLVEMGLANSSFGDKEFWDYVVVEGTTDGITWKPLADGYDSGAFDEWKEFAGSNINAKPNSTDLFKQHSINLHDSFNAGDLILIRFRIYSDEATTGYGWVIDDLVIQESSTETQNLILRGGKNPQGVVAIEMQLKQAYDVVELYVDGVLFETYNTVAAGTVIEELEEAPTKDKFDVSAKGYVNGQMLVSDYIEVDNFEVGEAVEMYLNSFEENQSDFIGSFEINNLLFTNYAIHSTHQYVENTDDTYTLSTPIIISDDVDVAKLIYKDIAFVDAGESGSTYGDAGFLDYVIVEGSKDGVNWLPLADGYDVDYSTKWTDFTDGDISKVPNSSDLFVSHSISLHDTFAAGDVILVRFRLYSDDASVGYGWVIDNLRIQDDGTGIFTTKKPEGTIDVSPNPAKDYLNLKLDTTKDGEVTVSIYDMSGAKELELNLFKDVQKWSQRIDVQRLKQGMKLITIEVDGDVFSQKFVKE
ncbi:T9SS type A sorting domain-containing protein [Carboxylicivirga sp. N1Y90]|uniref:T9SS type A sorting domain-containing protein n=1 Tax=Carboxylicivirga fragile TaxID=3417571 RepID=UPI003D358514|nr:T9SS type A sorting domain-containing protein [Marinilabiliaceae bacterium N1Y90]